MRSPTVSPDFTIGKTAKLANVSVQTLRYYERRGILRPVIRRDSGYRVYNEDAVRIVRFIKHAQQLGFSLEVIQAILSLKADHPMKCSQVKRRAEGTLKEVEAKIIGLEKMRRSLKKLIRDCERRRVTESCPILETFGIGELP